MRFGYTIIYVENVEKTILFYEKAFQLKRLFLHESMQYGELDTGSTKLAFASNEMAQANGVSIIKNQIASEKSAGFEIAFVTENVAEAYQYALSAGAIALKEPLQKPWGQTVAYVRDLNNVIVELCSPMG